MHIIDAPLDNIRMGVLATVSNKRHKYKLQNLFNEYCEHIQYNQYVLYLELFQLEL